jgi:arylsulfatase B
MIHHTGNLFTSHLLNGRGLVVALVALICPAADQTNSIAAAPPNILVILADDMGYGDTGRMGSELLETPNLDALADSGVLCTQAYVASAVCSPSRAGLMTGRDPRRFGYQANLNRAAGNYATRPELLGLPPSEKTLGDHLRNAGYATALVGKWHLGIGEGFHPNDRGFDYFCGMLTGSHHYFPATIRHSIERNGKRVETFSSDYLTDFFTDECVGFIERQTAEHPERPWFLFASYNAPHTPMQATDADLARFEQIKDEKRRTYAAMMYALDRGVGRIRQSLERSGEWDNTLCVFFSDNGGATNNGSWNGPLRGVKGCLREGGIRVPMIWTWPEQISGGQVCESVVSSLDLLPTLMAASGATPLPLAKPMSHEDPRNRRRMVAFAGTHDGIDLMPLLREPQRPLKRRLFWRLQGQAAVLDGKEKLVRLPHRPAELFRPATDRSESNELSTAEQERMQELFDLLSDWESRLPTVPLWGSSPYWNGQSSRGYDGWAPRPEPGAPDSNAVSSPAQ